MRGLVSGSFDPITLGHLDVINKAADKVDELIVCVFINDDKSPFFDLDTRRELIALALDGRKNIRVDTSTGMVADYCKANAIDVIFRGFRNHTDYLYETEMAKYNYQHCGVPTHLLPANENLSYVSSSEVRDRISNSGLLTGLLPDSVIDRLNALKEK